jgi:hypothetical protein
MSIPFQNILVITNSVELGCSIQRILCVHFAATAAVFSVTYPESKVLLTPQRVEETSLFVVELFRPYAGGLRAEGLVLADRWRRRKPSLVVSPLYLAGELHCPGYWDAASEDTLVARVEQIVRFPERCFQGFDGVYRCFKPMLKLPSQHGNIGRRDA